MELSRVLLKSKIFTGFDEPSVVKFLMHTHYQIKTYEKGINILYKNDERQENTLRTMFICVRI